ncbi:MAG: hypothetical protein U0X91_02095 [Spirosomataceae bacterium]
MKATESLSVWAARHPQPAIVFIIIVEVTNVLLGLMAGSALLSDFSPLLLCFLIVGLVWLRSILKRFVTVSLADLPSQARFWVQKQAFFGLFVINLMAYTLAGGIAGHVIAYPEASTNLYGGMTTTAVSSSESRKFSFGKKYDSSNADLRPRIPQKRLGGEWGMWDCLYSDWYWPTSELLWVVR